MHRQSATSNDLKHSKIKRNEINCCRGVVGRTVRALTVVEVQEEAQLDLRNAKRPKVKPITRSERVYLYKYWSR
jgi:hypothetical protein